VVRHLAEALDSQWVTRLTDASTEATTIGGKLNSPYTEGVLAGVQANLTATFYSISDAMGFLLPRYAVYTW